MKKIIVGFLVVLGVSLLAAKVTIISDSNSTKSIETKENNATKKIAQLTNKCEENNATACFKMGVYFFKGEEIKKDNNKSFEFFHKACDLNATNVCLRLAMSYEDEEHQRYDINKSIKLYNQICILNDPRACDALGHLYAKGNKTLKVDDNLSVKYFMKTCELADYTCEKIAVAYEIGKGLKQNTHNAIKFYEKACDNNVTQSCSKLGRIYLDQNDSQKAAVVLSKACEAKDGWSCAQLGNISENNSSVMFYDKACSYGSRTSCSKLGMKYLSGETIKKDINKALDYLLKACDRADANACRELGLIYENGKDEIKKNKFKSLNFLSKACNYGDKQSCRLK